MKRTLLLLMMSLLFSVGASAQKADEVKEDSDVQRIITDTSSVARINVSECDSLVKTKILKFAFAYQKGRVALYDRIARRNVTGLDYTVITYSCTARQGSSVIYVFNCATVDGNEGILFVHEDYDTVMFIGESKKK